jgi:hypothetical protein
MIQNLPGMKRCSHESSVSAWLVISNPINVER